MSDLQIWVDDKINVTEVCEQCLWHQESTEGALMALGLNFKDAQAFADYAFQMKDPRGKPDQTVTPRQWMRVSEMQKGKRPSGDLRRGSPGGAVPHGGEA